MTIFRCKPLAAGLLIAASVCVRTEPVYAQGPAVSLDCANIAPHVQRACVDRRIAGKERTAEQLLARARSAVARSFERYGAHDRRTHPRFLDQSQESWRRFVDSNCTVIAAFGGGSNSAISDRITGCYEKELDQRLKFLGQIAEGQGPFGQ